MYEVKSSQDKREKTIDHIQFENIVKISIIIGILIISGFIIYYILTPEPGFVVFGLLNEEKKAENYPTEAYVGENVSIYVSVENYLNRDYTFKVEILKGDNNTALSSSSYENATSYFNTSQTILMIGERWISEMLNISFMIPGSNQIIIAVLWEIIDEPSFFDILWLRLNILP